MIKFIFYKLKLLGQSKDPEFKPCLRFGTNDDLTRDNIKHMQKPLFLISCKIPRH